ncbi:MAG TPA: hypothetical protein VLA19_12280 [Herpetosiphonaceae bacterium]|nr:hypothetical protein [Herpetosiphonaceae bacterium]
MATIGLNELPETMRTVLAHGETLDITDQGAVVARLIPVAPAHVEVDANLYQRVSERVVDLDHLSDERPLTAQERAQLEIDLTAFDELASRIGAAWQDDMSALDAIREQRRDL